MTLKTQLDDRTENERMLFSVVHPLDDVPEETVDTEHLGPMRMTKTVRICLFALRGYLLLMFRAAWIPSSATRQLGPPVG